METLTKKNTILLNLLEEKEGHITVLNNRIAELITRAAVLNKNIRELENKIQELKKEQQDYRGQTLCNSGMEDLVYHLEFASDVIGDCWLPHYKNGGLDALKAVLRNNSKYIHKGAPCEECKTLIDGIFD
jgi:predicted nuclease with TOPRIM domain